MPLLTYQFYESMSRPSSGTSPCYYGGIVDHILDNIVNCMTEEDEIDVNNLQLHL